MKKQMWIPCALLLAFAAVGCGKKDKGTAAAQACVPSYANNYNCYGQQQYPNQPGTPIPGQPYPGNSYLQCAPGQIRLRNTCYATGDLASACYATGGQLLAMNGRNVCKSQRRISAFAVVRSNFCAGDSYENQRFFQLNLTKSMRSQNGEFSIKENGRGDRCISYTMKPNLSPNESLMIVGSVNPRYMESNWSLQVRSGYTVMATAQSGSIISGDGDNFAMMVPVNMGYGQQNYPVGVAPTNYNPQQPGQTYSPYGTAPMGLNSGYGYMPAYSQPITLEAQLNEQNVVRFKLMASSCEDGAGNFYTCY